jgi:hypothetical protein
LISSASANAEREFDEWYAEYPRKRAKGQAAKAYRAARKKASAETLLQRLGEQRAAIVARGLDYCPYPATWLNGERWDDEPPGVVQLHRIGVQPDGSRVDENGVRYLPDGSVDESTLPPVEDSWMKRRPR